jgi:hypothetical protein
MTPLSLQISAIFAQTTAPPSSRNKSSSLGPTRGVLDPVFHGPGP